MTMALPPTPKILWGPGYTNIWVFPGPADTPLPVTTPRGKHAEADSGARDWWGSRDDHELSLVVRFIPRDDQAGVTGYSSEPGGVREALLWMWKNPFRFYPDRNNDGRWHDCLLVDWPQPEREGGMFYKLALKLRDTSGAPFTEY
jgi:hypothetical protein